MKIPRKLLLVFISVIIVFGILIQIIPKVSADQYDDKINALQQDIDNYNAQAAQLAAQANTLQIEVSKLDSQAAIIQAQIDLSQAKYDKLVIQIADTKQKIKDNQDALGVTIANLYVDDNITPLEMLASSKNISDYLDKQEYRSSVRDELTLTIGKVKELKTQLDTQKTEVERILADQKNQHLALVDKQNEQQQLLTQTKGDESAYQQMSKENDAEISILRSQQAAELAARARENGGGYSSSAGDGSRGGYPLKWLYKPNGEIAPLDYYSDDWGMYSRECTSYAAFKVDQAYGNMPYGYGNANQWDDSARNGGIPIGTTPKPGSVGVIDGGYYGHVAWVESVNSDGTINISHFNVNWGGDYAEWYNLNPGYFNYYIYFGEW